MRSEWDLFWKGDKKAASHPLPSTSTAMQNRWRNADDNRASMKREKNRYNPPVCFMICLYWNHIFLHNQNRILLQIRVLNMKASCKVQEGWKKIQKRSFLFPSWPPAKATTTKQTSFALSWKEPNPAVLLHLISREPHQESKKGSEGRGSLLAAFLLYPSPKN